MTKYKLIKEYPGSPKLGTIAEKESKIKSNTSYYYKEGDSRWCIYDYHVEDNPEYWEKVNEYLWYVVLENDFHYNDGFRDTRSICWHVHYVECLNSEDIERELWTSVKKHIFKTKEEAEEYVLYNKPCLSALDVMKMFNVSINFTLFENSIPLKEFIKSKL